MTSQDRPKRRLVVYVTEEMYERLNRISVEEGRSISNVAEKKIVEGFEGSLAQTGTAQHGTARACVSVDEQKIKTSVLNTLSNLPDENLIVLAEKLQRILINNAPGDSDRYPVKRMRDYEPLEIPTTNLQYGCLPAQHGTAQHGTASSYEKSKRDLFQVQGFIHQLSEFIRSNGLTQRSFKQKYNLDITQLSRWERGLKYPSDEQMQKFKKVMSGQAT